MKKMGYVFLITIITFLVWYILSCDSISRLALNSPCGSLSLQLLLSTVPPSSAFHTSNSDLENDVECQDLFYHIETKE